MDSSGDARTLTLESGIASTWIPISLLKPLNLIWEDLSPPSKISLQPTSVELINYKISSLEPQLQTSLKRLNNNNKAINKDKKDNQLTERTERAEKIESKDPEKTEDIKLERVETEITTEMVTERTTEMVTERTESTTEIEMATEEEEENDILEICKIMITHQTKSSS